MTEVKEFMEHEIEWYRKSKCVLCDQLDRNCSNDHVLTCISLDIADEMEEYCGCEDCDCHPCTGCAHDGT